MSISNSFSSSFHSTQTKAQEQLDSTTQKADPKVFETAELFPERNLSTSTRVMRAATTPIALAGLFGGYFRSLYYLAGVQEAVKECKELLLDIGAEELQIPSSSGSMLSAMYFRAERFKVNEEGLFTKWKEKLEASPRLASFLEADLEGSNFRELMRLPNTVLEDCSAYKKIVIRCIGANNLYEASPQSVMQHLYRGIDHLAFNYQGLNESTGTPSFEGTCADAYNCTRYVIDSKGYAIEDILLYGISMGGGPALFTASKIEGIDVFVDRTFSRLSAVRINSLIMPIFQRLAENFYPYPNEEWIKNVTGRACVLHARYDSLIDRSHADRLVRSYIETRPEEDRQALSEKVFIEATGGHYGPSSGDPEYAWYSDEASQKKYTNFIQDKKISEID